MWTRVGPRKHALDGVHISATLRIRLNHACAAAARAAFLSNYFDDLFVLQHQLPMSLKLVSNLTWIRQQVLFIADTHEQNVDDENKAAQCLTALALMYPQLCNGHSTSSNRCTYANTLPKLTHGFRRQSGQSVGICAAIAGRASFHHFVMSRCTAFAVIPKFEGM